MKIISTKLWPEGESFEITLPPGTYYVGDPCYALSDERYGRILEPRRDTGEYRNAVITTDEGLLVVWGTPGGDGVFDCSTELPNNFPQGHTSLGVDSGSLAIISLDVTDKYDPNQLKTNPIYGQLCGHFVVDEPYTIEVCGNGNVDNGEEHELSLSILVTVDEDDDEDDDSSDED